MRKSDNILIADTVKDFLDGIKECVGTFVMLRLNPFAFEYSPQSLGNIEMWGIWGGQIDDVKVAVLPLGNFGFDLLAFVKARIIQQKYDMRLISEKEIDNTKSLQ